MKQEFNVTRPAIVLALLPTLIGIWLLYTADSYPLFEKAALSLLGLVYVFTAGAIFDCIVWGK